jgi:hypothetical protein
MKKILLHAIQPSYAERGDRDWKEFLRAADLAELPKQTEHLAPNVAPYVWVWPFVGNPEAVVAECPVSNAWYLARPCRVATSKETPERRCRVGHRSWV